MREAIVPIPRPAVSPTLETIRKQFQIWRKNGRAGRRIPDALWGEAVELCRDHSVSKISWAFAPIIFPRIRAYWITGFESAA